MNSLNLNLKEKTIYSISFLSIYMNSIISRVRGRTLGTQPNVDFILLSWQHH